MPTFQDQYGEIWRAARRAGPSTLNTGLIGSWPLTDPESSNKLDYSDNEYDLTDNGDTGPDPGKLGTVFDGSDTEYLDTDNASAPNLWQATGDNITIAFQAEFFSQIGDDNQFNPVCGIWDATTGTDLRGWSIGRGATVSSNLWLFRVSSDGTLGNSTTVQGPAVAFNTTYNVICRYDGSNVKISVNGSESSASHSTGILRDTSIPFYVARSIPPNGIAQRANVRVYNLSIWNRALSDSERDEWYNSGVPLLIPFIG